jgi:hypothetical protein
MNKGDAPYTLGTFGPLTLVATCSDDSGDEVATIKATTSADNLYFDAEDYDTDFDSNEAALEMTEYTSNSSNGWQTDYPRITNPAGGFSTFTDGYPVVNWVNHLGYDCYFEGYMVNNVA